MKEETTLSKHNYSQYSNKNNKANSKPVEKVEPQKPEVKPVEPVIEAPKPSLVQETVETVTLPNVVTGVVAHCAKLNVRKSPVVNSEIVCVLDAMSELKIDVNKSTENWYYVCAANGAEGYCMKPYIDAHM